MKQFIFLAVFVVAGLLAAQCADASATISGSTPTTMVNGGSYTAASGDTLNLSKNGAPAVVYTITSTMATAGTFTFIDSSSSNCNKDSWVASYTSVASGLTSAMTAAVTTTIDGVGCAVKFVPGLTVK